MLAWTSLPLWYSETVKHLVRDKAIILRRKPFGEADLLLTLYTQKNGKVRVVAKGARKITSKMLGFTELFTVISCQIDFSPSLPIVSQVIHEQIFDGIAESRTLYERLSVLAELIDRGCEEQESNPALFRTLEAGFYELVADNHPLSLTVLLWRAISLLGFAPQVTECAVCGEVLTEGQATSWSEMHGGVVTCAPHVSVAIALQPDEVKLLRYVSRANGDWQGVRVPEDTARRLEGLLLGHVQTALDQHFLTAKVLRG
jgi:DNA repair protein RecO (recombination protein O)